MEGRITVFICLLVFKIAISSGEFPENSMYICKTVVGLFGSPKGHAESDPPVLRGPTGPKGKIGRIGLRGPAGKTDYKMVNEILEKKVHIIEARLYRAETHLAALKNASIPSNRPAGFFPTMSPEQLKYQKYCMGNYSSPSNIGPICYKIIGADGLKWSFSDAEKNCTDLGGYLADLDSREVYDLLYDYVDRTYSIVIQAWTGMNYINKDKRVTLTTGKNATFVKWMQYNPSSSSYYRDYNRVAVNIDSSSRIMGLRNRRPSMTLSYAICHFDVSGKKLPKPPKTTPEEEEYDDDDDYYYDHYDDYDYYDYY